MGLLDIFNHQYPYTDFHELNLSWIIEHFKEFIDDIDSLESWRSTHEKEYNELKNLTNSINARLTDIENGDFPESLYNAMKTWWEANSVDLVGELVRFVFFGLTIDGYFVAYIPENWREINFDTIITPSENYGKLCIIY